MDLDNPLGRLQKPRCVLVYALAPPELPAAAANHQFNEFVGNRDLPLVLYHDHFIGRPGGLAIFHTESAADRQRLMQLSGLDGWQVELRPLIFARSPAAFDEQIDFTLRAYRDQDWQKLRTEARPVYGDPQREAETAEES